MNGLTLHDARDGGELALDQVLSDHSESHAMPPVRATDGPTALPGARCWASFNRRSADQRFCSLENDLPSLAGD